MIEAAPAQIVLGVAVVFARVGGVFMVAPGLSSSRTPVRVRLFLALGLSLALTPMLLEHAVAALDGAAPADILAVIGIETLIGIMIGLLSRLLLMALSTVSVAISNFVGLGGIAGMGVVNDEPSQPAANLFMATAVAIIFLADLHYEVLRALVGSYVVLEPGAALDPAAALESVSDSAGEAFLVGLRLAAPFLIYSVVVNFAVGLTNKMSPQLPIYFVSLPFVTAGGLIMIALTIREMMVAFMDAFAQLVGAL